MNDDIQTPELPELPADAAPPELQNLFFEAMFWKQKYFELLAHSNQVIGMLSRPPASPEQLASAMQVGSPEDVPNVAENGAQPPPPPNRAARRNHKG